MVVGWAEDAETENGDFLEREREPLLSRFSVNPTVGILRSKKEGCSTRRGLRVGSGFKEF